MVPSLNTGLNKAIKAPQGGIEGDLALAMTCHSQTKISNDDYDDNDNDANEAIQRKMYHCMYRVMFDVCCRGVWRLESLSPRQYSKRRTSLYVLINTVIKLVWGNSTSFHPLLCTHHHVYKEIDLHLHRH